MSENFGTGPLTKLDERVLAALDYRGQRFTRVAARVRAAEKRNYASRVSSDEEIRGVLRGFEHLGHATGRGGWWRVLSVGAREDAA